MIVPLLSSVIEALNSDYSSRFRTLNDAQLRCDEQGCVECYIGSNVVVVPLVGDESLALRFYLVERAYLREIYGGAYHPAEFSVGESCIDVVETEWIEGKLLAEYVEEAAMQGDGAQIIRELSRRFDLLASLIVDSNWAHGDLCCHNIIVAEHGDLHLIDNDSNYIPELAGCCSEELGHRAYQSPCRDIEHFHPRIDDFSIALLSVSLAALSIDPNLYRVRQSLDSLLFDGACLSVGSLYDDVANLLKRGSLVAHLALLRELRDSTIVIDRLPELLQFISGRVMVSGEMESFERGGLWGYRDRESERVVIPPMFDVACDFDGDEAIVSIERVWYKLDRRGSIRINEL